MRYRLGLDIGTNSIGWAILGLDESGNPEKIVRVGSRIFSDGRNPKDKTSLAVARRDARSARRRRDRNLDRKSQLLRFLQKIELFPTDKKEMEGLKNLNPYELRAKALDEELSAYDLGRVFMHLVQRRGFKSSRKNLNSDEGASLKPKIDNLRELLETSSSRTYGEFLFKQMSAQKPARIKEGVEFYPIRHFYEQEFDSILESQKKYHSEIDDESWRKIKRLLFYQRPLKPVEVGPCQAFFSLGEKRAHIAYPSYQQYLINQNLKNLKIIDGQFQERDLTENEELKLRETLNSKSEVKFDAIRELLELDERYKFNLESDRRKKLKGNGTAKVLSNKKAFGDNWHDLEIEAKDSIVSCIISHDEKKDEELADILSDLGLSNECAEHILSLNEEKLPRGVGRFSLKALRQMNGLMVAKNLRPEQALKEITKNVFENNECGTQEHLSYYGKVIPESIMIRSKRNRDTKYKVNEEEVEYGKIGNPTVHIGLGQLRKLVNAIIKKYGSPDEIHVEFVRSLKMNEEAKKRLAKKQKENQQANEKIKELLAEQNLPSTKLNITKYKLWTELSPDVNSRCCPYSGRPISISKLFSDDGEVEIEHILPFSRTLDDSLANKTVSFRKDNKKKGNRSPYEAFFSDPGYDYDDVFLRASELPKNKFWRFSESAMRRFDENNGWLSRQLNDTSYLAKISKKYLQSICNKNKIRTVPGQLTSLLRHQWGMNSILSKGTLKDRTDHRHHAIDAIVVGLTDTRTLQMISKANAEYRYKIAVPEPMDNVLDEASDRIEKMITSHRVDHSKFGQLHEETNYGEIAETSDERESGNLITKKPISTLVNEKQINAIRDQKIREDMLDIFHLHGTKKATFEAAVRSYSEKTGAKSVRIFVKNSSAHKIEHCQGSSSRYRCVIPGDVRSLSVWKVPSEENIVVTSENLLASKNKEENKPHPGAKKMFTLHKGDTVSICSGKKELFARVTTLRPSEGNRKIGCLPVNVSKATKENEAKEIWIAFSKFKERKLRPVRVNEIGDVWDAGCRL